MLNGMTTVAECLNSESRMGYSRTHPSSRLTFGDGSNLVTPAHIREWLTQSSPAGPANRTLPQVSGSAAMTNEKDGPPLSKQFAKLSQDGFWAKTCRGYSQLTLDGTLEPYCATWPRQGMTVAGASYRQPNWARRIGEIVSGLWPTIRANEHGDYQYDRGDHNKPRSTLTGAVKGFPTPKASDATRGAAPSEQRRNSPNLEAVVKMWPTPTVHDANEGVQFTPVMTKNGTVRHLNKAGTQSRAGLSKVVKLATPQSRDFRTGSTARWEESRKGIRSCNLNDQVGGKLNPNWIDWLMGWPIGWTGLEPLAMDKFRLWLRQHGIS